MPNTEPYSTPPQAGTPIEIYRAKLHQHQVAHERWYTRHRRIGNSRLATGLAAVVIAAVSIGGAWISPWWLVLPLAVFMVLAVVHSRVERSMKTASRAVSYYERAVARGENRWVGTGEQGERFRDPKHLYADDLDIFGRGSLFELLSASRTAAGDRFLASWLLAPGELAEVRERQAAVDELRSRLDLREQLAIAGEDVRAAADDQTVTRWGEKAAVRFPPGARIVAPILAAAVVATLGLWLVEAASILPLLIVILAEMAFSFTLRGPTAEVAESMGTPSRELALVAQLLAQLEAESFSSPALARLRHALDCDGRPASEHIGKLTTLVYHFDSARNQFFMAIAAPLLWMPQFAMAIEAWRHRRGRDLARWTAAIGEFEALCSLACFAYERPAAIFPELSDGSDLSNGPDLHFEATGLSHPLIAPAQAIGNGVDLNQRMRLWIVSGSNMSGKSTLLRAIGLNTVLAWAGAPVTATALHVSRFAVGASLRTNDSLADNRSRFYAEISRLREIVDLARAGKPTLFLLDELLSGTNSHDRRIGAEALIRGLVQRGALGLVTTHDLALAEIVPSFNGAAANVHFEDHLEGGEIRFDYQLREGVVTRSNALALMRAVGLEV